MIVRTQISSFLAAKIGDYMRNHPYDPYLSDDSAMEVFGNDSDGYYRVFTNGQVFHYSYHYNAPSESFEVIELRPAMAHFS
jgi:hypothetical protein